MELLANGSEIELRARGPERKALLSVIAADLDALNESFQGLRDKVDKRHPLQLQTLPHSAVPEFFAQKNLLRRKEDNRLKVECPHSYEDVDVLELLDGIRVDKLPGWAKEEQPRTTFARFGSFSPPPPSYGKTGMNSTSTSASRTTSSERGIYLEIVRWENFLDAMSETRLQDEYNKELSGLRYLREPVLHQDRQVHRGGVRYRAPPVQGGRPAAHLHVFQARANPYR